MKIDSQDLGSILARQAARFLDSTGAMSDRPRVTARQQQSLRRDVLEAAQYVRWCLESLEDRMRAACDRCCLHYLAKMLAKPGLGEVVLRTAYGRDLILQLAFSCREFNARWRDDEQEADRIRKLRDFWNHADKGTLALNRCAREALIFLRELHVYTKYAPASERSKVEAQLSRRLLNVVKKSECEFELALGKAKQFRVKRQWPNMTEEGDLRADLTFTGILYQLVGEKPPKPGKLMEAFAPGLQKLLLHAPDRARNVERNWRKLLNETLLLPKKKRGRPRKGTD